MRAVNSRLLYNRFYMTNDNDHVMDMKTKKASWRQRQPQPEIECTHDTTFEAVFKRSLASILASRGIHTSETAFNAIVLLAEEHMSQLFSRLHKVTQIQRRQEATVSDLRITMDSLGIRISDLERERKLHLHYTNYTKLLDNLKVQGMQDMSHDEAIFHSQPTSKLAKLVAEHAKAATAADAAGGALSLSSQQRQKQTQAHATAIADSPSHQPAYLQKGMPAFPPEHTFKSTPVYTRATRDPRQLRELVVQEGQLAEMALRRLESLMAHGGNEEYIDGSLLLGPGSPQAVTTKFSSEPLIEAHHKLLDQNPIAETHPEPTSRDHSVQTNGSVEPKIEETTKTTEISGVKPKTEPNDGELATQHDDIGSEATPDGRGDTVDTIVDQHQTEGGQTATPEPTHQETSENAEEASKKEDAREPSESVSATTTPTTTTKPLKISIKAASLVKPEADQGQGQSMTPPSSQGAPATPTPSVEPSKPKTFKITFNKKKLEAVASEEPMEGLGANASLSSSKRFDIIEYVQQRERIVEKRRAKKLELETRKQMKLTAQQELRELSEQELLERQYKRALAIASELVPKGGSHHRRIVGHVRWDQSRYEA